MSEEAMHQKVHALKIGRQILLPMVLFVVSLSLPLIAPTSLSHVNPLVPAAVEHADTAPVSVTAPAVIPAVNPPPLMAEQPEAAQRELVAQRTANSATFDLGDGQYALVQDTQPMHYQDAAGAWQRIDPAFVAATGGWTSAANSLKTGVAARNARANLALAQTGVGWEPHSLAVVAADGQATPWATVLAETHAITGALSADARTVTYPASWSDPALQDRWDSGYGQAEYSLRIEKMPNVTGLEARSRLQALDLHVTLHLFPGTHLELNGAPVTVADLPLETSGELAFVSASGETLWLQPPQAYEQGDPTVRVAGSYQITAGADESTLELAARIPYAWLAAAERQFPVVLDPVFHIKSPTTAKVAFYSNAAQTTFDSWLSTNPIGLGQYPDGVTRALLRFEMPSLPPGVEIDSAYLEALPQNAFIPCAYNVAKPEVCWGAGTRAGLATTVRAVKLTGPTDWWITGQVPYPVDGDDGQAAFMYWDTSEGGYNTRWNITDWVQDWQNRSNNFGVMLRLDDEFCYTDRLFETGMGPDYTIRHFPDGCGVVDIQNPTTYDPAAEDFTATAGGIRLVVTYTGPTLYRNTPINGMIGEGVAPPSTNPVYYNADHEYRLQSAPAGQWQALSLRGLGTWVGPNPPTEADPGPRLRPLEQGLPIALYTSSDQFLNMTIDPYQTEDAPGVNFALFNGNVSTHAYRARVKVPGKTLTHGYEIGLKTQSGTLSTLAVAANDPTPNESITFTFSTADPLALLALRIKPGTNSRVDVSGHNQFHNEDFNHQQWFRAWLFKGTSSGVMDATQGTELLSTPPHPGLSLYSSDLTPQAGDEYALVLTYNGPETYYYGATSSSPEHPEPMMLHEEFNITVRVTSCPAGSFPLSTGECQRVVCPSSADLANPAIYREAGGFGLWSDSGWSSAASPATSDYPGNAPLVGPPNSVPTIAIIEGNVTYNGTTVTVAGQHPRVKLVDCNTLASPRQNLTDAYYFDAYLGAMKRTVDGSTPVLQPEIAISQNNDALELFKVWRDNDKSSLSAHVLNVRPLTGDVQGKVRLARNMAGDGAGPYALTVDVAWSVTVAGWPTLATTVALVGNPTPPAIAGLTLDLGSLYQMDISAARGKQVARQFEAVRATDATISQPDNMGGASGKLQAVILPDDTQDATLGLYCAGKSCVDLRAPDDVFPGAPKRTWQMPDIHTNNTAGLVTLSTPGSVQAWSVDHPAMANSLEATGEEFSFNTSGASVRITQEICDEDDPAAVETQVIRGETLMTLPMIGESGATQDTMIAARFKLCSVPDVALRMVEFEFRSPVGVPVGSTGLFVNGMKGNVTVAPDHVNITFAMDFYFSDPNTLQGTGEVRIDTRGYFKFSGDGKILGTVDANGELWVAWNPLDTGFEMGLHYGLGNIAAIDGTVRAHAWRGQGWQNTYSWLPNDPTEAHFAAQISASFVIYEGAVIDMWPLVIPPVDFSRSIEIAFGQFCTNNGCTDYEWGIKAALEVCGYNVGVYYGFDHGVSLILGNDGHTLIDQYGGATYAAQAARIPLADGEELGRRTPGVAIQTAPQAVNGVVSLPVTVTADTEELLVGIGWQTDEPLVLRLYRPGQTLPVPVSSSNPAHNVFISDTTKIENGITTHSYLIGVQIKQPNLDGIWEARISGVTPESHYKFAFLANSGAPGTRTDRGEFTAPGATDVQSPGMYTLRWRVDADATANATINLYYTRYIKVGNTYYPYADHTDVPIVLHHDYHLGYFNWHTFNRIPAKCKYGDGERCYYRIRAVVDDGVNTLTAADISDPGDFCKPCQDIPASAFDPDRFPGTSTFTSVGHIWATDSTAPAAPTGLDANGVDGALLAHWNPSPDYDLESYLVEWGRVTCPALGDCTWDGGAPTHAERVAPTLTPTLRIGGVTTEGLVLGQSYGVVVSAIDINGNVSARSLMDTARPNSDAAAIVPSAPLTPTLANPTSTGIRLSWTSDGDPDHYRLIYRQVMTFTTVMQIDNISPRDFIGYRSGNVVLTGLETGATYEAWVTAANSNGWHSAYSPPVTFTVSSGVDSDGDGMPDDWETTHQMSLASNDSDRDGLTDVNEYRNGTHPWEQDSDGDGFSDGEEVTSTTNPLSASFYPAAFTLPRPRLASNRVNFYFKQGENYQAFQDVGFYNDGGGILALSATDTAQWLNISVRSDGNYVRLFADAVALSPGVYETIVRVYQTSGAYVGGQQCIRVRLHLLPADDDYLREFIYLPMVMQNYTQPQSEFAPMEANGDAELHTSIAIDPPSGSPYGTSP